MTINMFDKWTGNQQLDDKMVSIPEILDVWDRYKDYLIEKAKTEFNPILVLEVRQLMVVTITYDMKDKTEYVKIQPFEKDGNKFMIAELLWHSKMPYKISGVFYTDDKHFYRVSLS